MFKRVLLTYHLPTTEFKLKKIGQQLLINTSLVSSTNYGRSNFFAMRYSGCKSVLFVGIYETKTRVGLQSTPNNPVECICYNNTI